MKTFHNMNEALPELLKEPISAELLKELLFALYNVEQLLAGGESGSKVIFIDSERDRRMAERQYALSDRIPESEESITAKGEVWSKRVYILDDAGNGIVCFQRVPPRHEN